MSNLYETVINIINAKSDEEARNIFYNENGIHVDNTKVLQSVISSFVRRKEQIIRKVDDSLIFDLENYNDIWNITFIAEYIKEHDILYKTYNLLLKDIEQLKVEMNAIQNKHKKATSQEEHTEINNTYNEVKSIYVSKIETKKSLESVNKTFNSIDWVKLQNSNLRIENLESLSVFKQAINILHKLRNTLEHTYTSYENIIEVNDNAFNVKIPADYLHGFNIGRIIAKEDDKIIVERTNNITSPILDALNHNLLKVESYFYNISPSFLDYLLDISGNDIKKIYQIPTMFLESTEFIPILISNGFTIDDIIHIPKETDDFFSIIGIPQISNKFDVTQAEYLKNNMDDIFRLVKYCTSNNIHFTSILGYRYIDNIIKLCDLGIKPELIEVFSKSTIENPTSKQVKNEIEILKRLESHGVDISLSKLPQLWIENKELLLQCIENGYINRDEFNFVNYRNLYFIASQCNKWFRYMKKYNFSISQLSNISIIIKFSDIAMKLLDQGEDIAVVSKIVVEDDIKNFDRFKKIYSYINSRKLIPKYDIEQVNIFDQQVFMHFNKFKFKRLSAEEIISILDMLNDEEINNILIGRLLHYNIAPYGVIIDVLKLFKILEIDLSQIKVEDIISNPKAYLNFVLKTVTVGFNPKIIETFPEYYDDIGIEYLEEIIELYRFLEDNNIQIDGKIPIKLIESYTQGNTNPDKKLHIKYDNLKYLLKLVDNNLSRLDEFPSEFFKCDISLLAEMTTQYSINMNKCIFGIDNPKIISTLIYCNSVFSNYIEENRDFDSIDFDVDSFIKYCAETSNKYSGINLDLYNNQFILDEYGNARTRDEIKRYVLRKLRNVFAHFRFKTVKDESNNICSDKILIYDTYDEIGGYNFSMVVNISQLVELARTVEVSTTTKYNSNSVQTM